MFVLSAQHKVGPNILDKNNRNIITRIYFLCWQFMSMAASDKYLYIEAQRAASKKHTINKVYHLKKHVQSGDQILSVLIKWLHIES